LFLNKIVIFAMSEMTVRATFPLLEDVILTYPPRGSRKRPFYFLYTFIKRTERKSEIICGFVYKGTHFCGDGDKT
jgi:hypothetical protein